jgi:hypothetical protein
MVGLRRFVVKDCRDCQAGAAIEPLTRILATALPPK